MIQYAPTEEVAAAPSISNVKEDQLLRSSSPAAMSTHSEVELPPNVGEDQKLAEAVGRLNVLEAVPCLSGAACRRYKKLIDQGVSRNLSREQALNPKTSTQNKRPRRLTRQRGPRQALLLSPQGRR